MNSNHDRINFAILKTTCCCGGLIIFFIASLILLPYELFFISAMIILYFLHILENKINSRLMQKPLTDHSENEKGTISESHFIHQNNIVAHYAAPETQDIFNEVNDETPKSLVENLECVLVDE